MALAISLFVLGAVLLPGTCVMTATTTAATITPSKDAVESKEICVEHCPNIEAIKDTTRTLKVTLTAMC